jgi:hypothetical protein
MAMLKLQSVKREVEVCVLLHVGAEKLKCHDTWVDCLYLLVPSVITFILDTSTMAGRAELAGCLPRLLVVAILLPFLSETTLGQPAALDFEDCFSSSGNMTEKLNISTVYAQITGDNKALNLTVIGQSDIPIIGRSNDSTKLGGFVFRSHLCMKLMPIAYS